ncbi:MAG: hypothetical protein M3168_04425 [Actinomycetota bacterium]|nr:hypothetical protein [Actinomycetota bacterium]
MTRLEVQPRDTPEERHDRPVEIPVDEALSVHATTIEDWIAPRHNWEVVFREGHDFGRPNNVEARLLLVGGECSSTLVFRLDQLDAAEDFGEELVLRFEERNGIAKTARLTSNAIDVEFFHILTFT